MDIRLLVRKNIAELEPYSTARDEYKGSLGVFLDANENPYENGVNRYPSTSLKQALREKIALLRGVDSKNLFMGNGSDEAIDLCYRVFGTPGVDNVVMITPSYGMYAVCADINNIECRKVQLSNDFSLPVKELLDATDDHTKLMFLCSPNNPTANAFPQSDLIYIIEHFSGIVVVDEAYIDFSDTKSLKGLISKYDNLIILQTLSKAYAMAGLRIGLAISNTYIIYLFKQVKYPYNIGSDTISLAFRILDTDVTDQIATIKQQREEIAVKLQKFNCIEKVYPSDANFILVKVKNARELYEILVKQELIVRDRSTTKGCEGCLRITIGTPSENQKLLRIIEDYDK